MATVLHWVGVALGLLVVAGGIRLFVRGLSMKENDPSTRVSFSWKPWWGA
jgi:hypothetical protein